MSSRLEKLEARKRGGLSRKTTLANLVLGSPKIPTRQESHVLDDPIAKLIQTPNARKKSTGSGTGKRGRPRSVHTTPKIPSTPKFQSSPRFTTNSPLTPRGRPRGSKDATPRTLSMLESAFNRMESSSRGSSPGFGVETVTKPSNDRERKQSLRKSIQSPKVIYTPPVKMPKHTYKRSEESKRPLSEITLGHTRLLKSNLRQLLKKRSSISKIQRRTSGVRRMSNIPMTPKLRKSQRVHKLLPKFFDSDVEEEPDLSDFDSDYRSGKEDDDEDDEDEGEVRVESRVESRVEKDVSDEEEEYEIEEEVEEPASLPIANISKKQKSPIESTRNSPVAEDEVLQKPKGDVIIMQLERLSYTPNAAISKKISSLDVLSQVLSEFLSGAQPTRSSLVDRKLLRNYGASVSDHFTRLIDNTLNNENLTKELVQSNKIKDELRSQIFNTRKKHDELLLNTEKLRKQYHLMKRKRDSNQVIERSFKRLRGVEDDSDTVDKVIPVHENTLLDKVTLKMLKLDKVINPDCGLVDKFEQLNEKLSTIDADI